MDKKEAILFAVVMVALAVQLYMKYIKKKSGKPGSENKASSGSMPPSSSKDDDYEPYQKK
jgi:hypothetical protein